MKAAVWWPGMSKYVNIKIMTRMCQISPPPPPLQPLISSSLHGQKSPQIYVFHKTYLEVYRYQIFYVSDI